MLCFGTLALAAGGTVTASISAPDKGPVEVVVRNQGSAAITAYVYRVKWAAGSVDQFEDSAVVLNRRPVAQDAAEVRRPSGGGPHPTVTLRVALFIEGSSFGDQAWVARLAAGREYGPAPGSDAAQ